MGIKNIFYCILNVVVLVCDNLFMLTKETHTCFNSFYMEAKSQLFGLKIKITAFNMCTKSLRNSAKTSINTAYIIYFFNNQ